MEPKSILLTGCSSGVGYFAAHGLKKRGWRVVAACRKASDCARLAGEGLDTVRLDYADTAGIGVALDDVLGRTGGRLDALVNNGGYSQPGAIEDVSTELLRAQFETNVFGWHELTRRVVPVMRRQGSGRIVNVSSVLGYVSGRFRGAYAGSKHAIEALSDALRLELAGSGIDVVLIEPGPIRSRFIDNALARIEATIDIDASVHREAYRKELGRLAGDDRSSRFRLGPEAVFAKLVDALESPHPKARYRVTLPAHAAALLKRLLSTRMLDRILLGQ